MLMIGSLCLGYPRLVSDHSMVVSSILAVLGPVSPNAGLRPPKAGSTFQGHSLLGFSGSIRTDVSMQMNPNMESIVAVNQGGDGGHDRKDQGSLSRKRSGGSVSRPFVKAEQMAARWSSWLTSVAGEAFHGLIPLNSDALEKLEKIGQGTYSSVFRARDISCGRMVALKKVRYDNYQPESIRFMAREISILQRLNHPNIMKLDGIIISRLSSSIYLVFDYWITTSRG